MLDMRLVTILRFVSALSGSAAAEWAKPSRSAAALRSKGVTRVWDNVHAYSAHLVNVNSICAYGITLRGVGPGCGFSTLRISLTHRQTFAKSSVFPEGRHTPPFRREDSPESS